MIVRLAPLLTVSERIVPGAAPMTGWLTGPLGMTTSSSAPGAPAGLQFVPVAQTVFVVPVQVLRPVTVNTFVPVPTPKSGLVTVMLPSPVVAEPEMLMVAVRWLESVNPVVTTLTPAAENDAIAPAWKPVPVMTTARPLAPWAPVFGAAEVTVGTGLTVNTPVPVPVPVSRLVTVTLPAPRVAPADTLTLTLSWVGSMNVDAPLVTPAAEKVTVAPAWKFVPLMRTVWFDAPRASALGLVEVTVGRTMTVITPESPVSPPPASAWIVPVPVRWPVKTVLGPLVVLRSLVATPPVVEVIDQVADTLATKLPIESRLMA